jgi:hypothetical protein
MLTNSNTIEIVFYAEAFDNIGREKKTKDLKKIKYALKASDEFNDEMRFEDRFGNMYFIDDLIGKTVKVGDETFEVKE